MQEVQAIVLALERHDSTICERLDSRSLTILCSIFIYSQECLAQQRGLCLLAVSLVTAYSPTLAHYVQKALHRDKRESAQKAAQRQGKKIALGQAALTLLIKGFVKIGASDRLRRWVGGSHHIKELQLICSSAWNTCSGAAPRLSGKHREATVRSAQRETLVS